MATERNLERFVLEADFPLPDWLHNKANEACDRIEEILGVRVKRVRVAVVRTLEEMPPIVGQQAPQGSRGLFLGGRHTIVIMEPRNPPEAYALIAHETTHLMVSEIPDVVALSVPPWFFEGLALYVSEQERLREEIGFPSLLDQAVKFACQGLLIDLRDPGDLMSWASGTADQKTLGVTMTQGYHLVSWIAHEYREGSSPRNISVTARTQWISRGSRSGNWVRTRSDRKQMDARHSRMKKDLIS